MALEILEFLKQSIAKVGRDAVAAVIAADGTDAFGSISHASVIQGLSSGEFEPALVATMADWLKGRSFSLKGGTENRYVVDENGAPQGSVAGPRLFDESMEVGLNTVDLEFTDAITAIFDWADDVFGIIVAQRKVLPDVVAPFAQRIADGLRSIGISLNHKTKVTQLFPSWVYPLIPAFTIDVGDTN